jgi:hypothetical protein
MLCIGIGGSYALSLQPRSLDASRCADACNQAATGHRCSRFLSISIIARAAVSALFTRRYVDGAQLALNLNEQHPSTVDASDQGQQSPWNNPIDPTRLV